MMPSRFERLNQLLETKGLDAAIITSPSAVKCFSGFSHFFETGPSPFQVSPATLFFFRNKGATLLLTVDEWHNTATVLPGINILSYSGYTFEQPLHYSADYAAQSLDLLRANSSAPISIGIEQNSLSFNLAHAISQQYPDCRLIDLTAGLTGIKSVKDADEIEQISLAAAVADIGQESVMQFAAPGITELELFSKVRLAMESLAGKRIAVMTDLVSGPLTASGGGNPSNRIIGRNELILADFTPCVNGYWGDSCNTMVVGTPTNEQRKDVALVEKALKLGVQAVRPGAIASDIDRLMRQQLAAAGGFAHHGGHGVGTVYHEEPRIVPYNESRIEPGMVIALEPAIYRPTYGIRLEHLILVTREGNEVLTKFVHRFAP